MSRHNKQNGNERLRMNRRVAGEEQEIIELFKIAKTEVESSITHSGSEGETVDAEQEQVESVAPSRMQILETTDETAAPEGVKLPTAEQWNKMDEELRQTLVMRQARAARRRQRQPLMRAILITAGVAALAFATALAIQNYSLILDWFRQLFGSPATATAQADAAAQSIASLAKDLLLG